MGVYGQTCWLPEKQSGKYVLHVSNSFSSAICINGKDSTSYFQIVKINIAKKNIKNSMEVHYCLRNFLVIQLCSKCFNILTLIGRSFIYHEAFIFL